MANFCDVTRLAGIYAVCKQRIAYCPVRLSPTMRSLFCGNVTKTKRAQEPKGTKKNKGTQFTQKNTKNTKDLLKLKEHKRTHKTQKIWHKGR